jgi:hypothetical protein
MKYAVVGINYDNIGEFPEDNPIEDIIITNSKAEAEELKFKLTEEEGEHSLILYYICTTNI